MAEPPFPETPAAPTCTCGHTTDEHVHPSYFYENANCLECACRDFAEEEA
jgi:hypothetical protein